MKRLSALLVGAFMLVGVNSVIAIEGDFQPLNNSAINAAKQMAAEQRIGETDRMCADLPSAADGEGVNIERVCVNTWESPQSDVKFDFENPSY